METNARGDQNVENTENGSQIESLLSLKSAKALAEIKSALECPVCCDYISQTVLQCLNGHLLCLKCRRNVNSCPMCRADIRQNIRCLPMEQLAAKFMFPCKYAAVGCDVQTKLAEMYGHEEMYPFRPYDCPFASVFHKSCEWSGHLEHVLPHVVTHFNGHIAVNSNACNLRVMGITNNLFEGFLSIKSFHCYSHNFLSTLLKISEVETGLPYNQFCLFVMIIGDIDEKEKFAYELEMSADKTRVTWESSVPSIRVSLEELLRTSLCLDYETLKLFIPSDDCLYLRVKISRKQ